MNWINIVRITLPGIIVGLVIGRWLVKRPHYLSLLHPKKWISEIKKTRKDRAFHIGVISLGLGIASYLTILLIHFIFLQIIGPEPFISEDNIFTEISQLFYPLFLASIILVPVIEEWLFRGIILTEIKMKTESSVLAIMVSALTFAVLHLSNPGTQLLALIPYSIGGIFMGVSYILGGLASAIFSHIIYNLMPIMLSLLIN